MLLFLHGFLGQKEDWNHLFSYFKNDSKQAIDLPGHGSAPFTDDVALAIKEQAPKAKFLIGYSAGGRIALELKRRFPEAYEKVILISAHPGGLNEDERKKRWIIDKGWIDKLRNEPFEDFLEKWYSQELFSSLKNSPVFLSMLERRKKQDPHQLAQFLQTYSLSKKTSPGILLDAFCICGKEDLKYEKLYRTLARIYTIKDAGHAIHLENPKALAEVLQEIINEHNKFD